MRKPSLEAVILFQKILPPALGEKQPTVGDLMTKEVISLPPDAPVLDAHKVLEERRIKGLPVVDGERRLLGVLTEHELFMTGSSLHLPTLQKIFSGFQLWKGEKSLEQEIHALGNIKVGDVMNRDPMVVSERATLAEVVVALRDEKVTFVPVINEKEQVVGVVSRHDILKIFDTLKQSV